MELLLKKQNNVTKEMAASHIPEHQKLTAEEFQKLVRNVKENKEQVEELKQRPPFHVVTQEEFENMTDIDDNALYFVLEKE